MPSSTPKQAHFMSAVAHSPGFAKKAGVPQAVGKEFNEADRTAKVKALKSRKAPMAKRPAVTHGEPEEGGQY